MRKWHYQSVGKLTSTVFALAVLVAGCAGTATDRPGPRQSIMINTEPQGARVYVAGREIGSTPLKVVLDDVFPQHWTARARPDEEAFASYRRKETVDLQKDGCEFFTHVYVEEELKDDITVKLKCDPNYKPPATGTGTNALEQRLRALEDLKSKGLVTDEEYRAQRQRILNSM